MNERVGNRFYAILKAKDGTFYSYTFDMGDTFFGRSPDVEKVEQKGHLADMLVDGKVVGDKKQLINYLLS